MTIAELLAEETRLVEEAPDRYGHYFDHALDAVSALGQFPVALPEGHYIFASLFAVIRKCGTLAFFSTIRRHKNQAGLNLRVMLETSAIACFALANPDPRDVLGREPDGKPIIKDQARDKAYKWLKAKHPRISDAIEAAKKPLSNTEAHGNLTNTWTVFDWDSLAEGEANLYRSSFFDLDQPIVVEAGLWRVAAMITGVLESVSGVNATCEAVDLGNLPIHLERLRRDSLTLAHRIAQSDRYKDVMKHA